MILSLGNVFTTLHIDRWLTSLVESGMPAMVTNPYGFVLTISILAFVLHFFVPWMTASTIIALVAMPIAEGLGFHPFIPVLVALIAGDHTILPYVNSGYAIVYFASGSIQAKNVRGAEQGPFAPGSTPASRPPRSGCPRIRPGSPTRS